jgi:hypothetical protein
MRNHRVERGVAGRAITFSACLVDGKLRLRFTSWSSDRHGLHDGPFSLKPSGTASTSPQALCPVPDDARLGCRMRRGSRMKSPGIVAAIASNQRARPSGGRAAPRRSRRYLAGRQRHLCASSALGGTCRGRQTRCRRSRHESFACHRSACTRPDSSTSRPTTAGNDLVDYDEARSVRGQHRSARRGGRRPSQSRGPNSIRRANWPTSVRIFVLAR